jgi:Concanavalin A-like lectin/glucanases superfamily/FG-GAP-like repeat/Bacterial TSP3 repeat/PQQ-like domain
MKNFNSIDSIKQYCYSISFLREITMFKKKNKLEKLKIIKKGFKKYKFIGIMIQFLMVFSFLSILPMGIMNQGSVGSINSISTQEMGPQASDLSLVGNWNFEGQNTTDISLYGNTGSGYSISYSSGYNSSYSNYSMYFDGYQDYMSVADSDELDFTLKFTMDFYIKFATAVPDSSRATILNKHYNNEGYKVDMYQKRLLIYLEDSSYQSNKTNWVINEWYHIIISYDQTLASNNLILNINGTQDSAQNCKTIMSETSASIWFGSGRSYSTSNLDGYLDDIKLYNQYFNTSDQIGKRKWRTSLGGDIFSTPACADIDGDGKLEILVGSSDDNLYCIDETGNTQWTYSTAGDIYSSPAISDLDNDGDLEIVFGSRDNKVYCVSHTGTTEWTYSTSGDVDSDPAIGDIDGDGKMEIIIGSDDNDLYCLSDTGSLQWKYDGSADIDTNAVIADVDGDGEIEIVFATDYGRLICLSKDGSSEWSISKSGYPFDSGISLADVDGDGYPEIFVGSDNDNLYCYNGNGTEYARWYEDLDRDIDAIPVIGDIDMDGDLEVIVGNSLYENSTYYGKIHVYDASTGNLEWTYIAGGIIDTAVVLCDLGGDNKLDIVFGSDDNNIYSISGNGTLNWKFYTNGDISSSINVVDLYNNGTLSILFGDADDYLYCLAGGNTPINSSIGVWPCHGGNPMHTNNGVDTDKDKLPNDLEDWIGTINTTKDTDADGMDDGWEFLYLSNYTFSDATLDYDGDLLTNLEEFQNGCSPRLKDTDGDGLNDYEEVKTYKTNPSKSDTDGDGLSDYSEVKAWKTDPLNWDTDGDGLSDYDEIKIYNTDPFNPDTDGDGFADGSDLDPTGFFLPTGLILVAIGIVILLVLVKMAKSQKKSGYRKKIKKKMVQAKEMIMKEDYNGALSLMEPEVANCKKEGVKELADVNQLLQDIRLNQGVATAFRNFEGQYRNKDLKAAVPGLKQLLTHATKNSAKINPQLLNRIKILTQQANNDLNAIDTRIKQELGQITAFMKEQNYDKAIQFLNQKKMEADRNGLSTLSADIDKRTQNITRFKKLFNLFKISNKVKLDDVQRILAMNREELLQSLMEWQNTLKGFKIDGDYLTMEDSNSIGGLMGVLDNQFDEWTEKEHSKEGKIEDFNMDDFEV